ncbi:MAG: hypothetical protein DRJ38_09145 [Thermoprotei archaeon]|nr:MAG: hypothetical protein DRJ38_09145 [Thermoprotei archaeon]
MKFNKRGVSPVIAVLLLIVIAVAAAVLTYLWVLGYIGTVQSTGGTEQLQERIKIEGVNIDTSTDKIAVIYVRNVGDVAFHITSVYLSDASGVVTADVNRDLVVPPGNVETLDSGDLPNVTGYKLSEGISYVIKVVTKSGTEATYTFTYRK